MRSVVITRPGDADVLRLEERERPEPGPGQIRVRVVTSALNRADLLQRRGRYPAPPGVPADIPGLEYAGVVHALGAGVTRWREGDRVMGIVGGGAHAEFLCVDEREAMRIPERLGWEEAAAVPEVFLTAYDALFRQGSLQGGERLLILAIGSGVGTAALQLANSAGATVLGSSRQPLKLERARSLGLEHPIDSSVKDWRDAVTTATAGKGVDMVLDLVGGDGVAENLQVLRERGRLIVVGLLGGTRTELDLGLLLRRRLRVVGTVLRSRPLEEKVLLVEDFASVVLPLLEAGRVAPVIDSILSFDAVAEGHRRMEANDTFGKLVLRW